MFDETMKLVLGWSIVSAFIVTTIFTVLSLVGWIKFANSKQQQGLNVALVLEVVVGSVAGLRFKVKEVVKDTQEVAKEEGVQEGRAEGVFLALESRLAAALEGSAPAKRDARLRMIDLAEVPGDSALADRKRTLRSKVEALLAGAISSEAVQVIRRTDALRLDARAMTRGALHEPR